MVALLVQRVQVNGARMVESAANATLLNVPVHSMAKQVVLVPATPSRFKLSTLVHPLVLIIIARLLNLEVIFHRKSVAAQVESMRWIFLRMHVVLCRPSMAISTLTLKVQ